MRRTRRIFSRSTNGFNLAYLFSDGQGGGLYLPLVAYQNTTLATPANDAGETIAAIVDQKTTTETFTTFYTSDFSAGVDGFSGEAGCTIAGNIDGILGRDNCLRATVTTAGVTYIRKSPMWGGTTRNRTIMQVYVPAGQTYVDGFRVYAGSNSGVLVYDGANNGSTGAWVDIDVTGYVESVALRLYAYDGTSATINAGASGELMYVRGIVTSYSNLLNWWQGTAASQPRIGVLPKGRTVRNLFTTTTATFTTRNFTTSAVEYTFSLKGTGTVTLSGTSTAGPLVGTGVNDRVSLTFTPTAGTLTLTLSGSATDAQIQLGAAFDAYQDIGGTGIVTESGYPNVLIPYGDGGDSMSTGVVGFGSATQGLYAAVGQNWSAQALVCTFTNLATILAQCGASGASAQMLLVRTNATNTAIEIRCRGTLTVLTGTYYPGALNLVSLVCTNGVLTARVNTSARESVTVGAAAAEAVAITYMARTATSFADFNTGWGLPVDFADYAMSESVESQAISTIRALVGGP